VLRLSDAFDEEAIVQPTGEAHAHSHPRLRQRIVTLGNQVVERSI
jgi:hypothetical protein